MTMRSTLGRVKRKLIPPTPTAADGDDAGGQQGNSGGSNRGRVRNLNRANPEPVMFTSSKVGLWIEFTDCGDGQNDALIRYVGPNPPEDLTVSATYLNTVGTVLGTGLVEFSAERTDMIPAEQGIHDFRFLLAYELTATFAVPEGASVVHLRGFKNPEGLFTHQSARLEQCAGFVGPRFAVSVNPLITSQQPLRLVVKVPGDVHERSETYQLLVPAIVGPSSAIIRSDARMRGGHRIDPAADAAVDRDGRVIHALANGRSPDRPGRTAKSFTSPPGGAGYLDLEISLIKPDVTVFMDLKRIIGRARDPRVQHNEESGLLDQRIAAELCERALETGIDDFLSLYT